MREVTITSRWEEVEPGSRIYLRDTPPVDDVYVAVSGRLIPKRCFRWGPEVGDLVKMSTGQYGKVVNGPSNTTVEFSDGSLTRCGSLFNEATAYLAQRNVGYTAENDGRFGTTIAFTVRSAAVRIVIRNADDFLHFVRLCDA